MTELASISDIKIPYPVEGVIRTAQIDDTVAPEDSVQLAVNMNFDRVGAIQTRLGVTEYADSLAEEITNFGTLRNSIIQDGYERLSQVGTVNEISDTTFSEPSAVKISDTKIAVFWRGPDDDGWCQNFEFDETSGSMTPIGSPVEFDTANGREPKAIRISTTRVLVVWRGNGSDGFVRLFNVSGDTIVPMDSALEFDTADSADFTLALIDSTHVICFYVGSGDDGTATVFAFDTGTGVVTEPGSPLVFDSGLVIGNSCAAIGNGTHFINFWYRNGTGGMAQVFSVNTGTWAITAIGTAINFSTGGFINNAVAVGDGEHFINMYDGATAGRFEAQAFEVDTGTYAVTEVGTSVLISPSLVQGGTGVEFGDGEHFVALYSLSAGDGYVQMLAMNPTTFDMSLVGNSLAGYNFGGDKDISSINIDLYKIVGVWGIDDELGGESAMFQSFGSVVNGRWLYAGHADEVSNWEGTTWTVRRSGLAQISKPRFAQYLNYIWMVNGNESIGGDPVATSNGGDFGTDLVPEDFPAGDFISAGFEGRVWVVDKTLGIVYYTDIVQFVPPSVYSLSYNPEVNFITQIAPQTGQTFTGIHEVPRALLIFTEDSIYRIYGATSLDAYPAYNVGTYSQESIVETKTGIFFHHSSGFYQFDYGSQPVEISRRIIDFVEAIPRSAYEDITGVYDGFDAVEWSVGQVVVEGVVYSNCVLRYTISTQVWTIYDYPANTITAMISYDDGDAINHIMGTQAGLVGAMDTGYTDFGEPFYFEFIDRWRSFTDMYYKTKAIDGFNIYSENAAGANLSYQQQKSGPNQWTSICTVTEANNSLQPNSGTGDFDVIRLRLAGNTTGARVVVHCIEITDITLKGQDTN